MSCDKCGTGSSNMVGHRCESRLDLCLKGCRLFSTLDGVPQTPVDLGPAIKECETLTTLGYDYDKGAIYYIDEDGQKHYVYSKDIVGSTNVRDHADFCDDPYDNCGIVIACNGKLSAKNPKYLQPEDIIDGALVRTTNGCDNDCPDDGTGCQDSGCWRVKPYEDRGRVSFISTGFRTVDESPDVTLNVGEVYQYTLASGGAVYDDSDTAYNEIANDGDRNLNIGLTLVSSPTVYDDDTAEVLIVDQYREWDFNTSTWGAWGAWGINSTDWLSTVRGGNALIHKTIAPGESLRFQSRTTITCLEGTAIVDKWAASFTALSVWEEVSL